MNTRAIPVSSTLLGLSLAFALLLTAVESPAKTYTVTTTADFNYGFPGGPLSLRAALNAANSNPGEDAIVIPAGTFTLTQAGIDEDNNQSGDLDIRESVVITGAGPDKTILDGGKLDRVIHIPNTSMPVQVSISNLTIMHGWVTEAMAEPGGAGICNWKTLTLDKVGLSSNTVEGTLSGSVGGGILNRGYLIVLNSTFYGNYARVGGGLFTAGSSNASISNSLFWQNRAFRGGGITSWGYLSLKNTTIHDNRAQTFSALVLEVDGSAVVSFCTITSNSSSDGFPAVFSNLTSNFFLNYSILAGNRGGVANTLDNCSFDIQPATATFNLEDGNTCGFSLANRINTDPQLGPLADNGGYTQTRALLKGSPAIDGVKVANTNVTTDQRGIQRPQGTYPDIGAYEYVNDQALCFPVKSANNQIAIICM